MKAGWGRSRSSNLTVGTVAWRLGLLGLLTVIGASYVWWITGSVWPVIGFLVLMSVLGLLIVVEFNLRRTRGVGLFPDRFAIVVFAVAGVGYLGLAGWTWVREGLVRSVVDALVLCILCFLAAGALARGARAGDRSDAQMSSTDTGADRG